MIQPAVHPVWCVAEETELLLQIGVDSAEENAGFAHIGFISANRGVDRHQDNIFAKLQQRGRQRVVVQTTAAIHPSGTSS